MGPRFNKPLCNHFLGKTNDILLPGNGKMYGKESRNNETSFFTITATILARMYCQYAERHMNLKFMRRVSEREREIRAFDIVEVSF